MLLDFKTNPNLRSPNRGAEALGWVVQDRFSYSRWNAENNIKLSKDEYLIIKYLLESGADLRENPPWYGGDALNIFWYICNS